MMVSQIMQLCVFVLSLSAGQVLFKKAALSSLPLSTLSGLWSLALNLWFWAALFLYGLTTILWIFILQRMNLTLAYPFSALAFLIVPVLASQLFQENLPKLFVPGALLIIAGIFLISCKGQGGSCL